MMATNHLIHYALDLETPPLIACDAPDSPASSSDAAKVTCPDCMSHDMFPRASMHPKISGHKLLTDAASLLSENGENPEYDRAIIELTSALIGAGQDDRILMTRILRALSERL